jgi:hypothetical protein
LPGPVDNAAKRRRSRVAAAQEVPSMNRTSNCTMVLLSLALAGLGFSGLASAQAQILPQPTNSDPSAPLSPTVERTTSQVPSPTSAAHTASEVLAYLVAYDNVAIALARQGRDRRVDPQIRALAASMLTSHSEDLARVRALAAGTETAIVDTGDVKARTDLGGSEVDRLSRVTDADYPARFLDAVTELNRDLVDLVDKRMLSDVADDPRMVKHLQATRDWVLAEKATADALRASGK